MNDRSVELLEQYEVEVRGTRKGRGAILCDTDQGTLIFKEYTGNAGRVELQNMLLQEIARRGRVETESILPTREGGLFAQDTDGTKYLLKTWSEGRECNIYDKGECAEAVRLLARLHDCMELPGDTPGLPEAFSQEREYEKHNRELKRVKKYLKQRGQKTWFEISLLNDFDFFLEQALAVTEQWQAYSASQGNQVQGKDGTRSFCHGDYQYHNILKGKEGWFLVNFEKCLPDNPVRDVYLLMRKFLEKGNWSVALGTELLETYGRERPIGAYSWIDLYYRLSYPEKFWKIVNFYYNSGKAWIPGRNQEKLEKLVAQEKDKQHFLDAVFRDVSRMAAQG